MFWTVKICANKTIFLQDCSRSFLVWGLFWIFSLHKNLRGCFFLYLLLAKARIKEWFTLQIFTSIAVYFTSIESWSTRLIVQRYISKVIRNTTDLMHYRCKHLHCRYICSCFGFSKTFVPLTLLNSCNHALVV